VYSEHVHGMFCIFCSIFSKDASKGYFVSKLNCVWNKMSEKTKEHVTCSSAYHQECMELADNFKHTVEHLFFLLMLYSTSAEGL